MISGRPVVQERGGPQTLPVRIRGSLLRHLRCRVTMIVGLAIVMQFPGSVEVGVAGPHRRGPVVVQVVEIVLLVQRLRRRLLICGVRVAIVAPVIDWNRNEILVRNIAIQVGEFHGDRDRAVLVMLLLLLLHDLRDRVLRGAAEATG